MTKIFPIIFFHKLPLFHLFYFLFFKEIIKSLLICVYAWKYKTPHHHYRILTVAPQFTLQRGQLIPRIQSQKIYIYISWGRGERKWDPLKPILILHLHCLKLKIGPSRSNVQAYVRAKKVAMVGLTKSSIIEFSQ